MSEYANGDDFPSMYEVRANRKKSVKIDGIEITVDMPSEVAVDLDKPTLIGTFEADSGYTTMHSLSETKDVCVEIVAAAPRAPGYYNENSYVRLRMRITKEFAKSLREVLGGIK